MNHNTLWSLRLGFSNQQALLIEKAGLAAFLEKSFQSNVDFKTPAFLDNSPKSIAELREKRNTIKSSNPESVKKLLMEEIKIAIEMKSWWIDKMISEKYPLKEKMTCFWHNHFVATSQKVKVNYWVFQHNQLLRENAFGNFKELTKKVLKSNAMVRYLDNVDNRKDKINENLSRELLELFTLGIGNYTEDDIKNGAKALAGLGIGENEAVYRKFFEDNDTITFLGKTGKFKADDLVDIIFEQPNIPYLLTRKILKWFVYDNPNEDLVKYYGNYFRKVGFEIKPLLIKIFTEEFSKDNAGSKIKNPLEYILQLMNELGIEKPDSRLITFFIKDQGMDLFNQPNVKGWDGGNSWLTSQIFLQRNNVSDLLCNGKNLSRRKQNNEVLKMFQNQLLSVKLNWDKNKDNKHIINDFKERLLFQTDENLQQDLEKLLKYDFNSNTEGSDYAVMRLFNFITKTPEYQLI